MLTTISSRKTYTGDNSTVAFGTEFKYYQGQEDYITVYVDGVEQTGGGTHYTLTGGGTSSTPEVGTVTFETAPATDAVVLVERLLPLSQEFDFSEIHRLPAATIEQAMDVIVMMIQQLEHETSRTLRFSPDDISNAGRVLPNATDRANTVLGFDSDGNFTTYPQS
jgi:hypothetical protein